MAEKTKILMAVKLAEKKKKNFPNERKFTSKLRELLKISIH